MWRRARIFLHRISAWRSDLRYTTAGACDCCWKATVEWGIKGSWILNLEAHMEAGVAQEAVRKPGTFVKGDPRINRTTGPKSKKPRPFPLLMDMRTVYEQDESQDRGPAQKAMRKMFKENIDGFIARLGRARAGLPGENKGRKRIGARGGGGPGA